MKYEYEVSALCTEYPSTIPRSGHIREHAVWVRLTDGHGVTTPLVDYSDFDRAAVLAHDSFTRFGIARGRIHPSAHPGLGVGYR